MGLFLSHSIFTITFIFSLHQHWFSCPWFQYNAQFKIYEPLEYNYDVCEAILLWEQVSDNPFFLVIIIKMISTLIFLWMQYRNMTTVLTREYLDARPDGWLDYAAMRIAQLYGPEISSITVHLCCFTTYVIWTSSMCAFENWKLLFIYLCCCRGADKCYNRSLCEEHLNLLLPAKPPFHPRQFRTCAVVGNSGDLLKTEFGEEIDSHDAVIRDNEAPVNRVILSIIYKCFMIVEHFILQYFALPTINLCFKFLRTFLMWTILLLVISFF